MTPVSLAPVTQQFRKRTDVSGDHGNGGCHGFERCQTKTFPALRSNEEVERPIPVVDVGVFADEENAIGQDRR